MGYVTKQKKQQLQRMFSDSVALDVPLANISRWRIGGTAQVVVTPRSVAELTQVINFITQYQLPHVVIAGTSNLLFASEGLNAVVIQLGRLLSHVAISGTDIVAEAGAWVPGLARKAMQAGLAGLEHTCGIPGTLGGLVYMNGGSQRKGIGDSVTFVETLDTDGRVHYYTQDECGFAYRTSIFQQKNEIIIRIGLTLEKVFDKWAVHQKMLSILRERSRKFPRRFPNCGSTFVSNPAMYAVFGPPGKVIEDCGFKGVTVGGAQVAQQHANFINNIGNATSNDVLALIHKIREVVHKKTGCLMEVEARYVTPDGEVTRIDEK